MCDTLGDQTDLSLADFKRSPLDEHVNGILTNIMSMLFRLGWHPKHIDIWENAHGEVYLLESALSNKRTLLYDLIDSYNNLQYDRASRHFDGAGIQGVLIGITPFPWCILCASLALTMLPQCLRRWRP